MVAVEIVVVPVFIVLYDVGYAAAEMVPVALLTTLGIATVGTLFLCDGRQHEGARGDAAHPVLPRGLADSRRGGGVHQPGAGAPPGRGGVAVDRAAGGIRRGVLVVCPLAFVAIVED